MGNRLYYHKKHIVECEGGYFNWEMENVESLFSELEIPVCSDEEYCPRSFSIDKDDFKQGLKNLKKMTIKNFNKLFGDVFTKKDTISFFEDTLKNCEPNSNNIYFEWF